MAFERSFFSFSSGNERRRLSIYREGNGTEAAEGVRYGRSLSEVGATGAPFKTCHVEGVRRYQMADLIPSGKRWTPFTSPGPGT